MILSCFLYIFALCLHGWLDMGIYVTEYRFDDSMIE